VIVDIWGKKERDLSIATPRSDTIEGLGRVIPDKL